jgi:hypothetical protein
MRSNAEQYAASVSRCSCCCTFIYVHIMPSVPFPLFTRDPSATALPFFAGSVHFGLHSHASESVLLLVLIECSANSAGQVEVPAHQTRLNKDAVYVAYNKETLPVSKISWQC